MRQKRILYSTAFAEALGGGQRSLFLLLKSLNKERYIPLLMLPAGGSLTKLADKEKIDTAIMDTPSLRHFNFIKCAKSIMIIKRFLKEKDIDLIHTDAPRQTFYLGLLSKILKIPLIWHVRIAEPQNALYDKLLYFLSDKIIAVSAAAADRFKKFKDFKDKVDIIYNAVDLEEFDAKVARQQTRQKFGINDSDMLIGCVY